MFSQAPREKGRPRPAALRVSAFSVFRKSFRQEPAISDIGKDFPNLPKMRRWALGAAISRALRVCVLRDHSGTTKEIKVMQAQATVQNRFINTITQGDCIQVMREMPANSVDFILTDPPYLVNFCDRQGRTLQNDTNANWLRPAMAEAYRVLKQNRLMLCFYGWPRAEKFLEALREAGFRPVGHLVFRKSYTTKATNFLKYQHEQAYLLAKGRPPMMGSPISDIQRLLFTGNKLHPTQKAVMSLVPIIRAYSLPGDLVLDAFAGSASTCAAALLTGRKYVGIELDNEYFHEAVARMDRVKERIAAKKRPFQILIPTMR
jgi:DNA modification methylase